MASYELKLVFVDEMKKINYIFLYFLLFFRNARSPLKVAKLLRNTKSLNFDFISFITKTSVFYLVDLFILFFFCKDF